MSVVQDSAVSKVTRIKDVGQLQDYVSFCKGLGIPDSDILPASEDLLIAWASTYTGRLAGKTCREDSRALLTRAELLCSLADANSAAALAQWYKW